MRFPTSDLWSHLLTEDACGIVKRSFSLGIIPPCSNGCSVFKSACPPKMCLPKRSFYMYGGSIGVVTSWHSDLLAVLRKKHPCALTLWKWCRKNFAINLCAQRKRWLKAATPDDQKCSVDKGLTAWFSLFCARGILFNFLLIGWLFFSSWRNWLDLCVWQREKGIIGFELFHALGKKFVLSEVGKDMKCKQISACIYIL